MGIIPALDELKYGQAGLGLCAEGFSIEQFTFQGGKEALTQSVVEAVADRAHRRAQVGFPAAMAEGQGGILTALIRVMDDAFWAPLADLPAIVSPQNRWIVMLKDNQESKRE